MKADDIRALARWDATAGGAEGDLVHAGARAAAGLHRRARASSIWRRCATRMIALGGNPDRVNPLQPVELVIDHSVQVDYFGTCRRVHAERGARVLAQPRALRVPALGPARVQQFPGRAARHRHRPPGQHRVPGARRLRADGRRRDRWRIPTRWSAPIRTRRWSTGSAWWAGASAASRPRRRCSVSRSRC